MSDPRALLQQALEFVTSKQWGTTPYMDVRVYEDAARLRDTLRAALKQPEQEPVAWMDDFGNAFPLGAVKGAGSWRDDHQRNWMPLYTHQPRREWRGLTDEEIEDCWDGYLSDYQLQMIRAVEAKLKEKNT